MRVSQIKDLITHEPQIKIGCMCPNKFEARLLNDRLMIESMQDNVTAFSADETLKTKLHLDYCIVEFAAEIPTAIINTLYDITETLLITDMEIC